MVQISESTAVQQIQFQIKKCGGKKGAWDSMLAKGLPDPSGNMVWGMSFLAKFAISENRAKHTSKSRQLHRNSIRWNSIQLTAKYILYWLAEFELRYESVWQSHATLNRNTCHFSDCAVASFRTLTLHSKQKIQTFAGTQKERRCSARQKGKEKMWIPRFDTKFH